MQHNEPQQLKLGWIDFSQTHRDKVMKVIELSQPEGTVDELGIGVIRDALADTLFPGITTIMTRAKYYFIVPRIIHDYIIQNPKDYSAKEYLRMREIKIMHDLSSRYNYKENLGIIGINVAKENRNKSPRRWKELMRKPSSIYWGGIRTYKFYTGELSLENFLNTVDNRAEEKSKLGYQVSEGEYRDDLDAEATNTTIIQLPDFDPAWSKDLRIDLTQEEAGFLKDKIIDHQPTSFLAEILKSNKAVNDFVQANTFQEMCEMPFMRNFKQAPREIIYLARDFWEIMHGAHIRYNCILNQRHGSERVLMKCQQMWAAWVKDMKAFRWDDFDRDLLWSVSKEKSIIKPFTEHFINSWMEQIMAHNYDLTLLDGLVEDQESRNKGTRSKLRMQNDEKYDKWTGIARLDYRFANAKTMIRDMSFNSISG